MAKEKFFVDNVDEVIAKQAKGSGQFLLDKMAESAKTREFNLNVLTEFNELTAELNRLRACVDELVAELNRLRAVEDELRVIKETAQAWLGYTGDDPYWHARVEHAIKAVLRGEKPEEK